MDTVSKTIGDQAPPTEEPWVGVGRYAALTIAAYAVVFQLFAGFSPPVTIIGLVFLGFGVFIRNGRRKLALTSGTVALLLVVVYAMPLVDALTDLASLEAFALNLFLTLTALVAFLAGIGAIRRGNGRLIRPAVTSAVSLYAIGFAVSAVVTAGIEPADPLAGDARVVTEFMSYDPDELVVAAGSGIWLENRDGVRHTFTVEGTDLDLNVPGNSAGRADIDLDPGTYQVICGVPGHEAMSLDLTITEVSK
jgi:plastocyanin